MTSPVSPDSGCDVLAWIYNTIAHNGWQARERDAAYSRIAELLDAVGDFLNNSNANLIDSINRVDSAYRACRAGETT